MNRMNQVKQYRPDPKIALVIKSNANDNLNQAEKERYNKQVRETALGLYKNFKRTQSKQVAKATEDFIVNVAKSVDGKTFTLLVKHLSDLRDEVLDNPTHKLTPDSFLIFLDKIKNLTHSQQLNDVILRKIASVNLDELKAKRMLNLYQRHSFDFKFEENLRLGEIRQFAQEVIPKPRFLFDSYKTTESAVTPSPKPEEEDYFSFFNSHEKLILKPESTFKNVSPCHSD